jgi:two-component system response regulator YesN
VYKVLIVDDEAWVVKSLRMAVDWNAQGFEVIGSASDGAEAMTYIEERMPDLVVTDIRMPVMGGLELMEKARERWPLLQFVIISVHAEFEYARKAIDYGAAGYCLKPADEQELAEMLKKVKSRLESYRELAQSFPDVRGMTGSLQEQFHKPVNDSPDPATAAQIIPGILSYLDEHFAGEVTLTGLSERYHLNPSYLSRVFKRECGKTLTGYLVDLRMRKACQMLRGTGLAVNAIAKKCGYDDYFYFARLFKRTQGISPTQYRVGMPVNIPVLRETDLQ